jgi:hypothetical protein
MYGKSATVKKITKAKYYQIDNAETTNSADSITKLSNNG